MRLVVRNMGTDWIVIIDGSIRVSVEPGHSATIHATSVEIKDGTLASSSSTDKAKT